MTISIQGLQEAQKDNLKVIASLKPSGAFDNSLRLGTIMAHRFAVSETHVDTSALKSSHRMLMERLKGIVYIDKGARNPRTGMLTSEYGVYEHARGGEHAFYANVDRRHGRNIATYIANQYVGKLPR